jgi:hypothetical protein
MLSQTNYNSVFCDFLSLTFNPDHFDLSSIKLLLVGCGYEIDDANEKIIKFIRPDDPLSGLIRVESKFNHVRISVSGKALSYLRKLGQYNNLLIHFSEFPHNITRLDATMDVPRDFPKVCRSISRYYPDDRIGLSRKTTKIKYNLTKRDDGQRSGSIYFGNIRDQLQIIIYDKTLEMFENLSIVIPTTTRYEMRFKSSFNLTLRDASDPTELFWAHSGNILLKKPSGVAQRSPTGDSDHWKRTTIPSLPFSKLSSYIEHSTAIPALKVLADSLGVNGRDIALRLITESFRDTRSKSDQKSAHVVTPRKEGNENVISLRDMQQSAQEKFK